MTNEARDELDHCGEDPSVRTATRRRGTEDKQTIGRGNLPCTLGLGLCSVHARPTCRWRPPCDPSIRTALRRVSPSRRRPSRRSGPSPPPRSPGTPLYLAAQERRILELTISLPIAAASAASKASPKKRELAISRRRTWRRRRLRRSRSTSPTATMTHTTKPETRTTITLNGLIRYPVA